ncbi:MAG TPA: CYTH and CHAD domain-containing protein [Xanthobacteraceae bacterium]|nr:CYTH and CHAD domain-containing protein [Xanthobacteraceae bacterium]
MASHQEIEVKLRADPEKIGKMRRSRWWRELEPVSRQSLHSIYFDTDDRQLRDSNISLRTRTDGHDIVQTVKLLDGSSDTVSRREWETLVPDPIPDPSLVIDPALPQEFRKLTSADLHPVFDVDVKRETRRLTSDRAKIDVSLDDGAVIAGDDRKPVHEVELELVAGDFADLFAEAQRLSDAIDGRLHVRTKADLGYALNRGERRHWSRAPKLNLTPGMTAGLSFRHIILNSFAHLTANDDCARLNLHVEGVHQCRIALRRLRSAFKIYRPLLRRKPIEPIEDGVRWLGKVLGTARDLDVLQAELLEPASEALGAAEQLAPLMASLQAKKAGAYAEVGEALASARYRHFLIDLCALAHADDLGKSGADSPRLDQPLAELAARALSKAHRKLLMRGREFETLSETERHDVRIALKRLRYALDFFGGVFDGAPRKKFFKKLARLQDDLGRMNDVAVAQTMLAQLVGVASDGAEPPAAAAARGQVAFAAGGILGWHRRRAAEMDVQLIEDWNSFIRVAPFWLQQQNAAA